MTVRGRRLLLDLGAAAAGTGAMLAVWVQRLPTAPDFILARAPGDYLILPAARLFESSAARVLAVYAALALLVGALAAPAWVLWRGRSELFDAARPARRRGRRLALFFCGAVALLLAARWGASAGVDVIENALFTPESLDPVEPLLVFAAAAGFAMALWRSLGSWWGRVFSGRGGRPAAALAAAALVCEAGARLLFDAGQPSLAAAAAMPEVPRRGRLVLVLREEDGRPSVDAHAIVIGASEQTQYSSQTLAAVERYLSRRRTVFRRAALRYLYAGYTLEMDAAGLRRALSRGEQDGDVLARALLLDNLSAAPPAERETQEIFERLSDGRHRVGAAGAARLAVVARRLGRDDEAERWRQRAVSGPGGVPPGLLEPPPRERAGGRVEARARGVPAERLRLALYRRPSSDSPYSLGPGQLVASAPPGSSRLSVSGLPYGDYFLAVAVDASDERPPRLRVSGSRGDLHLSARRPRAEISLSFSPQSSIE